jgi:mono/diheme cytochrome c family protein
MAICRRRLIQCICIFCLSVVLSGQAGTGVQKSSIDKPQTPPFKTPSKPESKFNQAERNGRALYSYYCVVCHGETGKGDGFNSYNLIVHPRNFTDQTRMKALPDDRIKKVILNGGSAVGLSSLMPPWDGVLTEKQASDLVAFIRKF